MLLNELLNRINDLVLDLWWALRYPLCENVEWMRVDSHPLALAVKKHEQSSYRDSLVAVLKRRILDHEIEEDAGFSNKGWVQIFARKRLERSY